MTRQNNYATHHFQVSHVNARHIAFLENACCVHSVLKRKILKTKGFKMKQITYLVDNSLSLMND